MKKIIINLLLLLLVILPDIAHSDFKFTIKNFYLEKPEVCKKSIAVWSEIESKLIYNIKAVKYFRLYHYKFKKSADLPELIRLNFKISKCTETNIFVINAKIRDNKFLIEKEFKINGEVYIDAFPVQFVQFLKQVFPLTGVILKVKENIIVANIGLNFYVNPSDTFFISDSNDKIIGCAVVLRVERNYSVLKVTKNIQPIEADYTITPFTFNNAKILNSHNAKIINSRTNIVHKFQGMDDVDYKVFLSPTKNIGIIADSKKINFINFSTYYNETIDSINYNSLDDAKISYYNSYAAIKPNVQLLGFKIFNIKSYKTVNIMFDPASKEYLLSSYTNLGLAFPDISAFAFSKSEELFFINRGELLKLDIPKEKFAPINIENQIDNIEKIYITPNEEKLIMGYSKNKTNNIFIKDLDKEKEIIITNVDWYLPNRIGSELIYSKNENEITIYNLYTKKYKGYLFPDLHNTYKILLSYSEMFLAFLNGIDNNDISLFDFKNMVYIKDIFRSGEKKIIKNFEWIPGYDYLLIFGKLTDFDKNGIIDYRDIDELIMFDPITRKEYKILNKIDKFYNVTPDGNYILYRKGKKLYYYQIPYERILTK